MEVTYVSLATHDALTRFVHETLCNHDYLDPAQTPINKSLVIRAGKSCGLFFQIHGPRLLRTHAVWAASENRILFYDSNGHRFAEARLTESPDPLNLAA